MDTPDFNHSTTSTFAISHRNNHEDASKYETMKKIIIDNSIDAVFNLAVIPLPASLDQPIWTFNQNVDITSTLCEIARNDLFNTLIHFSSSEAYGTCVYAPMDENHPMAALPNVPTI